MSLDIQSFLGIHEYAVGLRSQKAEILAHNITHVDTPGFQAKEGNFEELLQNYQGEGGEGSTTSLRIEARATKVDAVVEKSEYARNAAQYLASLEFLKSRFRTCMVAVKGS
jgi:flagellar basal-body rod protein FlgB